MPVQSFTQFIVRSIFFIALYQYIANVILYWKQKKVFSISTLFKIELLLHVIMKIWLLRFVSLDDEIGCGCGVGEGVGVGGRGGRLTQQVGLLAHKYNHKV